MTIEELQEEIRRGLNNGTLDPEKEVRFRDFRVSSGSEPYTEADETLKVNGALYLGTYDE